MHDNFFRFRLAQAVLVLLCVNGNASSRRDSRSLQLQEVVESGNLFAEDVYKVLTQSDNSNSSYENKNLMISPLSIHIALAMLMAGAAGNTEKEILKGLRIRDGMAEEDIHKGFTDLITKLKDNSKDDGEVQLQIANRIFVGQVYPIKPNFLHTIRKHYFADAEQVDFAEKDSTANKVNDWVQKATRNRIKDIIVPSMLNNQTAMILVNTIHFKGEWKFPFNPDSTTKKQFTTINGNEVTAKMMKMDRPRRFKYAVLPELRSSAVALPYLSQRYSMIILLPEKGHNLKEVEARIQENTLADIPARMRTVSVDVSMPKTVLEFNVDLIASKVIENLNMTSMTTQLAEFDRMSDEKGLRITNIIHKTFLEINEAGSEAAAATAFVAQARSLELEPDAAVKFIVDRPFITYIYDSHTKSILFVARKIS